MLIFVTVNWRNYLGRGIEYTNTLFDMLRRNLAEGKAGKFVVFTDNIEPGYAKGIDVCKLPDPFIKGWFNKLQLFNHDVFAEGDRIVFFDLDTVITGQLDDLAAYDGDFAILRDVYRPNGLQSSVMAWRHGFCSYIWDDYEAAGFPLFGGGDQAWIEKTVVNPDILQTKFPGQFVSYKRDARFAVPPGASVVFFHGEPRPHDCGGWVPNVWKIGAAAAGQLELVGNTPASIVKANIERSEAMAGARWLMPAPENGHIAIICAGGPSLNDEMLSIILHARGGAAVFACNAVPSVLHRAGVKTDYHVMLDARPENTEFVAGIGKDTVCLYASQCDKSAHDAAGKALVLWHAAFPGIMDIVGKGKGRAYVGGGTTCGMKAATLAWTMGYRKIHLYGFDSCYRDGQHHAYPQALNDAERMLNVTYDGKQYSCSPWMVQQAEDFETFAPQLMDHGVELHVHGSGLIPDIAKQFANGVFRPEAADFRALAILERLEGVAAPKVAEIGVFAGDLSRRLLARRDDLNLLMVDSWASVARETYVDSEDFHSTLTAERQNEYAALAERVTDFAAERRTILRMDSRAAAAALGDETLDMAFLDADHSYEGCRGDIEAYWPKVRPGGWLSGHDYANDDFRFGPMVKQAVDEFVAAYGLALELGENYTWHCVKPPRSANGYR